MRKEAYLTRPLSDGVVQCQVCEHFCIVKPGQVGAVGYATEILHSSRITLIRDDFGRPCHIERCQRRSS